jgi:hypothetical protein
VCSARRAEGKIRKLDRQSDWKGPRLHCECEKGHRWHENFGGDMPFLTDCNCSSETVT